MLNKNQSHKRNTWKYALIVPALVAFIFLFQIQTIAQERINRVITRKSSTHNGIQVVVDKNTSDAEMKNDAATLKKEHGVTLKYSKVKRNNAGEITGIKVEFKDKNGNKGVSQVDGNEPIKPIHFYKNDSGIGFGKPRQMKVFSYSGAHNNVAPLVIKTDDSLDIVSDFDFDFDFNFNAPEPPEAPESPEAAEAPAPTSWNENVDVVIKREGDKKPVVIINGKVLSDDKEIEQALAKYGGKGNSFSFSSSDGGNAQVLINGKDIMKIKADARTAMADAKIQMKRMRPEIEKQIEMAKAQKGKMRAEMDRARAQMNAAKPEMEAVKAEMAKAREEMLKAKADMEAAKADYEKAKAYMRNKK